MSDNAMSAVVNAKQQLPGLVRATSSGSISTFEQHPFNSNQKLDSSPIHFVKTKDTYKLEDFKIQVKLGKGAFGNVYLVELDPALNQVKNEKNPQQGKLFAMKVIDKKTILE